MADFPFNVRRYVRAFRLAVVNGAEHMEAVQRAALDARTPDDTEAVWLCALASGCSRDDALAAAEVVYAGKS